MESQVGCLPSLADIINELPDNDFIELMTLLGWADKL